MNIKRLTFWLVLFSLLLSCGKGNNSTYSIPPPPSAGPVTPPEDEEDPEDDNTPKPWDANRGKVVRPQAGNGWTITTIEPGIIYYAFNGYDNVSGANQWIYVTEIDLNKPDYAVKLGYYSNNSTASRVMKSTGAIASINAGYEKAALWLQLNGSTYSSISAATIGSTGVPQWKSEAAIYLNQDQDVRIRFTGKGKTLSEWRTLYGYKAQTERNFITSAPMLIDDYKPVGLDFCTLHPANQYPDKDGKTTNSENPYNHQNSTTNPRTAIAQTAEGQVFFIVVDGRRGNSVARGISCTQLTNFLVKYFNPQYAINLDGGGSSTMCVQGQGDPDTHVVNYPCDNRAGQSEDSRKTTIEGKEVIRPLETNGPDHAGERGRDTFFYVVKK